MAEYGVATGYTGGTPTLFWDGREMVELRMVDDDLATARAAAETLGARYFFKRIGHDKATQTYVWGAWDRHALPSVSLGKHDVRRQPLKTFRTNDTAPLIMWAAAKEHS